MTTDSPLDIFRFLVTGKWMDPGNMTTNPEETEEFPVYDPADDPYSFEPKSNDRGPQEDYSDA